MKRYSEYHELRLASWRALNGDPSLVDWEQVDKELEEEGHVLFVPDPETGEIWVSHTAAGLSWVADKLN